MENAEMIPVAALRSKMTALNADLRDLDEKRQQIIEERNHIEYVVERYGSKHDPAKSQREMFKQTHVSQKPKSFDKKEVITALLREHGKPMKSADIRKELDLRGTPIKQSNFDAIMSLERRNPSSPIKKFGYGKYEYRKQGDKGTPSSLASLAGAAPSGESAASISREL